MVLSTDIFGVFVLILAAFTLGSTFLSAYSVLNVARLRNVRISWKAGKMWGYPLFATIFFLTTLAMSAMVYHLSMSLYYPIVGCYAWIGINWFLASYLASKRYITDHGIVKNINDPSQTVAWYQMTDFVEKPEGKSNEYIFIYQNYGENEEDLNKCIRLELEVPLKKNEEFKKIVSYKLGKTISPEVDSLLNLRAVGD
jgi:hypothetical protein